LKTKHRQCTYLVWGLKSFGGGRKDQMRRDFSTHLAYLPSLTELRRTALERHVYQGRQYKVRELHG
jgi:hypothetical protein